MLQIDIRSLDEEKREVVGYAVPYGEQIDLGGIKEAFTRGAITDFDVPLMYQHKEPIGSVIEALDTDDGLVIRGRISETALGNDVVQLIKDKAVRAFSVGFEPVETDTTGGILNRIKVKLHEVSLVAVPHYSGAKLLAYRDKPLTERETQEETMEDNTTLNDEIATLKEDILELQRNKVTDPAPSIQYRSYGDYIKAVARHEDNATTLYRAWTGGTTADSVFADGWVGDKVRILDKPRKVLNAFGKATLPAEGLNVEYAKLKTNTIDVAKQSAEGELLAYGKVAVETDTAPVNTYGGYTTMTSQEVERASVNIVDKAFTAMIAKYAAATNSVVRAAVVAETTATATGPTLSSSTGKDWLGVVVDSATALDTYNYTLDALIVSGDVFKTIATLTDGADRPLLYTTNPSNNIGSVGGLSATLAGVPVIVDPGAAAKTVWAVTSEAATTYESSGAPFRLQDGDITNLTNAFSVYGYLAFAIHDPNGIVKVSIA